MKIRNMKKFNILLILVLLLISAMSVLTACNFVDNTVQEISLKEGTYPVELSQFAEADFSDVIVIAKFTDETTQEITADKLTFSEVSTDVLGDVTVTVSYNGLSATFTTRVVLATLVIDSIAVKEGTAPADIIHNTVPDFSGVVIVATYHNNVTAEFAITNTNVTISQIDTSTIGTKVVTVSYQDAVNTTAITTTFNVNVVLATHEIESIAVKSNSYNSDIAQFATPDFSDLVIAVTYVNDVTIEYPGSGFTLSTVDTTELGVKTVTVSYQDEFNPIALTTSFDVNIVLATNVISSIAVKANTYSANVIQNETYDLSTLVVILTYANNATANIPSTNANLTIDVIDTSVLGVKTINVSYTDEYNVTPITTTFDITVIISPNVYVSIAVKANTYATSIAQNSTETFNDLVVIATNHYSNTVEIARANAHLTVSALDTTTFGQKTVNVSYSDDYNTNLTTSFTVNVYEVSTLGGYYIDKYELPGFISTYQSNTSAGTTGENAYYNKTEPYYIGNDNKFVLVPKVTVVKQLDSKVLTSYKSEYEVSIWSEGAWVVLTGTELSNYVEIFAEESSFKFTDLAIGKEFSLKFTARELDIYEDDVFNPLTFEVSVIDAYNVYKAADLSVFDNFNNKGVWTAYKQANGIDPTLDVNGIVLHNNITLTSSDMPASYFYQEGEASGLSGNLTSAADLLGSLKSWTYAYIRKGDTGETFNFIGNYFSVDASQIPLGTENDSTTEPPINYSTLFNFLPNDATDPSLSVSEGGKPASEGSIDPNNVNRATNNIKNITFIGNATRAPEEDAMKRMGGLIMFKTNAHMFNMYNAIMRRSFTDIYVLYGESNFKFESCKAYDSYSNSMLFWENVNAGADTTQKTMLILDSEIKRSGGPALILNDYDTGSSGGSWTNNAYVEIQNSTIESYVTGEEGWFAANNASAAMDSIKGFDVIFNDYGKTYVKNGTSVNFMILMMPGDPLTDTYPINCWVKMDGVKITNQSDPRIQGIKDYMASNSYPSVPIFETSTGGIGFYTNQPSEMLIDFTTGTNVVPVQAGSPLLTGKYITCYLPLKTYLGAVFTYSAT